MTKDPKRQPKGTGKGGQFAPDTNPEATVDLGQVRLDRATAMERIRSAFVDFGDMADSLIPNDFGVVLLNKSRLDVEGEYETRNGVVWDAKLTIGDESLHVNNMGDGGCNRYDQAVPGEGRKWFQTVEDWSGLVRRGFPSLGTYSEPLDDFCMIMEAVQTEVKL